MIEKTYYSEASKMLKALTTAEDIYFLTNGVYTTKFNDLDVSLPEGSQIASCNYVQECIKTKNFYYSIYYNSDNFWTIQARRVIGNTGHNYQTYIYQIPLTNAGDIKRGNLLCAIAPSLTTDINKWRNFCKKMSGSSTYTAIYGGELYLIQ